MQSIFNTNRRKVRDALRNPMNVLRSIQSKAKQSDYRFKRLYRNLYNPEFFLQAYQNIHAKQGNMTAGSDGKTIDGMGMKRIDKIIAQLKNHSYQPNPVRRVYIDKKGNSSKKRPLGIPSIDDKLVQEVLRMILESIYEQGFSNLSHGFRPNRSCHTALKQVKDYFTGACWFIEGDIKGFFNNIDHQILTDLLRKRIADEYFIALIWKFLKAGYLEDWKFFRTYSGTPQGSIISPILSNVYLNELDKYMDGYMKKFKCGKKRKVNKAYIKASNRLQHAKREKYSKQQWERLNLEEREIALKELRDIRQTMLNIDYADPQDEQYRRLVYVRYADDWLCGVIGSKKDAVAIKKDIQKYLKESLKLELSDEKTLITNGQDKARFLGYDIYISNDRSFKPTVRGVTQRVQWHKVQLYVPREKWQNKLIEYKALKIRYHKGQNYKEVFEPVHRSYLINNEDIEIVNQYNREIQGIYNYYRIAHNVSVLNDFYYVMKFSMLKTFAAKYKSRIGKMRDKYGHKRFGVPYENRSGPQIMYFYDKGFRKVDEIATDSSIDIILKNYGNSGPSSLVQKISAKECEWCHETDVDIEIHHVRKLKDLKGKKDWERKMIGRRRKTMALCAQCHADLHAGRLD